MRITGALKRCVRLASASGYTHVAVRVPGSVMGLYAYYPLVDVLNTPTGYHSVTKRRAERRWPGPTDIRYGDLIRLGKKALDPSLPER